MKSVVGKVGEQLLFRKQYTLKFVLMQHGFVQLKLKYRIPLIAKSSSCIHYFFFLNILGKIPLSQIDFSKLYPSLFKMVYRLAYVECPEVTKNSRKG